MLRNEVNDVSGWRSFIENLRRYPFERDTYFVPLAYIEDAIDDGIHAGVGAREEEKSSLNAWVDVAGRCSIDPIPVYR